ncbi:nucleotidyltransferase domain-containing protein [Hydrogenobacter sp. T-2]|uniref:nucleotidyltransferase domain-containing protein n=1 Tax=Pampinifervens diazotrophicum TaxID=1632018 RepID=UPI002B25C42C|nr:nucleotidyltransferase domain-containing protein [Hydrogenobacter sp. T-2]WPM32974.1 nucleotidyltransferase domain-containing protein [Hydrogenobacter sp. T-2]
MEIGLDEKTIELLREFFKSYPKVERVYLFGSRAKGSYTRGSDIDLLLIAPQMSFSEYLRLYSSLEELDLLYEIDLIKDKELMEEGVEIYSRES